MTRADVCDRHYRGNALAVAPFEPQAGSKCGALRICERKDEAQERLVHNPQVRRAERLIPHHGGGRRNACCKNSLLWPIRAPSHCILSSTLLGTGKNALLIAM